MRGGGLWPGLCHLPWLTPTLPPERSLPTTTEPPTSPGPPLQPSMVSPSHYHTSSPGGLRLAAQRPAAHTGLARGGNRRGARTSGRAPTQGKWRGKQQVSGWQVNARGLGDGHHPGNRLLKRWQGLWAPHFVKAVLSPSSHSRGWWQGKGTIIPPFPLFPLSTEWTPGAETKVLLSLLFCFVQQRNLRVNEGGSFRERRARCPHSMFFTNNTGSAFSSVRKPKIRGTQH